MLPAPRAALPAPRAATMKPNGLEQAQTGKMFHAPYRRTSAMDEENTHSEDPDSICTAVYIVGRGAVVRDMEFGLGWLMVVEEQQYNTEGKARTWPPSPPSPLRSAIARRKGTDPHSENLPRLRARSEHLPQQHSCHVCTLKRGVGRRAQWIPKRTTCFE
ncbi:hypothetical protein BDV95DRAFT_110280 [Massariosphaeria phaeospora]|uniref:Uncharacterized protein n=1 Tax=Massariosphaeria phaeospora TaxID=100035 RepID=A0A7C8IA81_9PLEO|nr:hypothetical protein BDV95DRAFT_110280 [Massariosphaeria phaeospora]